MTDTASTPKITLGFAISGSFCTYQKILTILDSLREMPWDIIPIFSEKSATLDTRFQTATSFVNQVEKLTGHKGIFTIQEAEPIGPKGYLDALIIAPCTGNTLAKLCTGITDSTVLMAAKAHLRNEKPLIISISTSKHIFFVPFGQDNYRKKSHSMIAHTELIPDTILEALNGHQIQPVIRSPF